MRGFDVRTGKRLWIFHTIPDEGRVRLRHVGRRISREERQPRACGRRRAPTSNWASCTCLWRCRRPTTTASDVPEATCSPKVSSRSTSRPASANGTTRPCITACGTGTCPARPCSSTWSRPPARRSKPWRSRPSRRSCSSSTAKLAKPIWPIEERPVPQSNVPGEKTSPTQPFPTKPVPFDRQGFSLDDVMDFTPELKQEALEVVKRYKIGPIFTPPSLATPDGPAGTLMLPADVGGANWPGGAFDPETNRLFIHSHTAVFTLQNVPADLGQAPAFGPPEPGEGPAPGARGRGAAGRRCDRTCCWRAWSWSTGRRRGQAGPGAPAGAPPGAVGQGGPGRGAGGAGGRGAAGAGGRAGGGGRGGTTVQGLPLVKPPYDRITAYNMNTGDLLWQKTHSSTSDAIRNNPALKGLNLPQARRLRPHIHRRAGHQRRSSSRATAGPSPTTKARRSRSSARMTRKPVRTSRATSRCRPSRPARR